MSTFSANLSKFEKKERNSLTYTQKNTLVGHNNTVAGRSVLLSVHVFTCVHVCDMSWWGSWFGLLVGGTLIWHALTGSVLPSYSTDNPYPGNRNSNSCTQSTRTYTHWYKNTDTHSCKHTQSPLEAMFFLISLWVWWGQMGEQWESGRLSLEKQRHACTHTNTQRITGSPRLGHKWSNLQTNSCWVSHKHKYTSAKP